MALGIGFRPLGAGFKIGDRRKQLADMLSGAVTPTTPTNPSTFTNDSGYTTGPVFRPLGNRSGLTPQQQLTGSYPRARGSFFSDIGDAVGGAWNKVTDTAGDVVKDWGDDLSKGWQQNVEDPLKKVWNRNIRDPLQEYNPAKETNDVLDQVSPPPKDYMRPVEGEDQNIGNPNFNPPTAEDYALFDEKFEQPFGRKPEPTERGRLMSVSQPGGWRNNLINFVREAFEADPSPQIVDRAKNVLDYDLTEYSPKTNVDALAVLEEMRQKGLAEDFGRMIEGQAEGQKTRGQELMNQLAGNVDSRVGAVDSFASGYGSRGSALQNFLTQDIARRTGAADQAVSDYTTRRKTGREELAGQLSGLARQQFEEETPWILEDLNRRGLMTSSSEVNRSMMDALNRYNLQTANKLIDYDQAAKAEEDALRRTALGQRLTGEEAALSRDLFTSGENLRKLGLDERLGGETEKMALAEKLLGGYEDTLSDALSARMSGRQTAADRRLDLGRSKFQNLFNKEMSDDEQKYAEELTKKNKNADLTNAIIGLVGNLATYGLSNVYDAYGRKRTNGLKPGSRGNIQPFSWRQGSAGEVGGSGVGIS